MTNQDSDYRENNDEDSGDSGSGRATLQTVHNAIREDGENELKRRSSALAWSGLAAGMSMGFSLIAEGLLHHALPDAPWRVAVTNFGYSLGFVIVILGRQQLFTENTITVVIPLLHHKTMECLKNMLRVWGIVLLANLIGGLLVALLLANTNVFDPEIRTAFLELGRKALEPGFGTIVLRGIVAGWLIALLVWLLPASGSARLWIIVLFGYIVGLAHLSHVVAGSIEVFFVAASGEAGWGSVVGGYTIPSLIGNILGGVLLVAVLNHAQYVVDD